MAKAKYELIIAIVNQGFADSVMDAARACGAKVGTILSARGTARQEAEKKFDILIHPEKEMVMIIAKADIKEAILHAIYKEVGLDTPGQGIAFSTPVDDTIGIDNKKIAKAVAKAEAKEEPKVEGKVEEEPKEEQKEEPKEDVKVKDTKNE